MDTILAGPWGTGAVIAIIVLCVGGLAYWLVRRLTGGTGGAGAARGRQPRLALIDSASVDGRRRLVLVRRDNVEHLLMIGGPADLLIEQNIVRAVPVAPAREPSAAESSGLSQVRAKAAEPARESGVRFPLDQELEQAIVRGADVRRRPEPPWSEPAPPGSREGPSAPARPYDEIRPEPVVPRGGDARSRVEPSFPEFAPPRSGRSAEQQAKRTAAEVGARGGSSSEVPLRPAPPITPAASRPAPAGNIRESVPAPNLASDAEITDMAQRLEAALRRPMMAKDGRAEPVPKPTAGVGTGQPARESGKPREPVKVGAEPHQSSEASDPKGGAQSVLDSLEQEMASLLGRPAGKD
jgi:flagellar protein FliO/FliZ